MGHWLVYGGTFDPIHNGHLRMARAARELMGAEGVLLMPAGVSPHKVQGAGASADDRLAMIRLAIVEEVGFEVDDRELRRAGPSYTIDTVMSLVRERAGDSFTLLLGADQLAKLHSWHRMAELVKLVRLAILPRAGFGVSEEIKREVAGRLAVELGVGIVFLEMPLVDISATELRQRVRAGLSIEGMTAPAVVEYIGRRGLYR